MDYAHLTRKNTRTLLVGIMSSDMRQNRLKPQSTEGLGQRAEMSIYLQGYYCRSYVIFRHNDDDD